VHLPEWALRMIFVILNLGVIILALGFILGFWPLLVLGAIAVVYAVLWWAFHYVRWYIRLVPSHRNGAMLFGLIASVGLVVSVVFGGYLIHVHLSNAVSQNIRLAHIHSGLVAWGTIGLLGIGVALRGGNVPILQSIPVLKGSAWMWLAGAFVLIVFMSLWQITFIMIGGVIVLLGFLGYGYSIPRLSEFQSDTDEKSGMSQGLLPYIILGFLGLLLTILIGFDITINYPSGRAGIHQLLGIGAWILMTYLMSMLSEIPRSAYALLEAESGHPEDLPMESEYRYPAPFRAGWVGLTLALLVATGGYFVSQTMFLAGLFLLGICTFFLAGYVLLKYRV